MFCVFMSVMLCMHSILSRSFECYNSSWDLFGVGASSTHSCYSLCISYISLNIAFGASTLILLNNFSIDDFFCVLMYFATTMFTMATSFYYGCLWIAIPCATLVFCFTTICNNFFFCMVFFCFCFCFVMCVFVMLFASDL